jgi:prepilin-type processing-associated H-X9-DG protein
VNGIFFLNSKTKIKDITDGASNTLFFAERFQSTQQLSGSGNPACLGGWSWINTYSMEDQTLNTANAINTYPESIPMSDRVHFENKDNIIGSGHPQGANTAFADGSVHFLRQSIDVETILKPLSTINFGEVITGDY